MAHLGFDARTVVPDAGQQDPVPAGWYKVVIEKSDLVPTSDGTGLRLTLVFKIIDGQYINRKLFEGLNLKNNNPQAQEIAFKQLSAIAHATNVLVVDDSSQLHNIPLQVKVKVVPATAQYEAKNEIKAYKNINEVILPSGAAPAAPAAFGVPAAPAAFAPPPAAFTPPAAPGAPAAWTPPAATQPWVPPTAPAQPAPVAAPAPAAAPAAPAAPAPVAAAPAPGAGVVPPWQQPAA